MNVRQEFEKLHHNHQQRKITQGQLVAGLSRLMMYARTNDSEFFPTINRALDSATWKGGQQAESDGRTGATKTIRDKDPEWLEREAGRTRSFDRALDRQMRKSKKNPPYRAMKIGAPPTKIGECEVGQTISGAGADWKVEIKMPDGSITARCLDDDHLQKFSAEELQQFTVLPGLNFSQGGETGHHPLSRQTRSRMARNSGLSDAFEIRAVANEVIQELVQEGGAGQHTTSSWLSRVPADQASGEMAKLRGSGAKNLRAVYRDRSGQKRYYKGQEMVQGDPSTATRSGHALKKHATHADIYNRGYSTYRRRQDSNQQAAG